MGLILFLWHRETITLKNMGNLRRIERKERIQTLGAKRDLYHICVLSVLVKYAGLENGLYHRFRPYTRHLVSAL